MSETENRNAQLQAGPPGLEIILNDNAANFFYPPSLLFHYLKILPSAICATGEKVCYTLFTGPDAGVSITGDRDASIHIRERERTEAVERKRTDTCRRMPVCRMNSTKFPRFVLNASKEEDRSEMD